jgi:hypothetical protein
LVLAWRTLVAARKTAIGGRLTPVTGDVYGKRSDADSACSTTATTSAATTATSEQTSDRTGRACEGAL